MISLTGLTYQQYQEWSTNNLSTQHSSKVSISAELGVPELSQCPAGSAGLALKTQKAARVKVTARVVADSLHPGTLNSTEIDARDNW